MKYCTHCGNELLDEAVICPRCGCSCASNNTYRGQYVDENSSKKSRGIAILLCALVGGTGAHRFYVGKTGTGVLWLLTFGLFGIGTLIDLINIAMGNFRDSEEKPLTNWNFDSENK